MFGKNKEEKAKGPSPQDLFMNPIVAEVEQLAPGQSLIYKLPEFFWGGGLGAFLICELNPAYPKKGRKYIMSSDQIADGKPAGKKTSSHESNNPKDYAEWVWQFKGERFS